MEGVFKTLIQIILNKKPPYRAHKNTRLASKQLIHLGKGNRIRRCKSYDVNAVEHFSLGKKRRWECEGANEKLQGVAAALKTLLSGHGKGFRQVKELWVIYDHLNIALWGLTSILCIHIITCWLIFNP